MKKSINLATAIGFLFLVFAFTLAFWILPDQAFSD